VEGRHAEEIERARALTRRRLGAPLEGKASDAFCLTVAAASAATPGLEALRAQAAGPALASIVEFTGPAEPVARLPAEVSAEAAAAVRDALAGVADQVPEAEKSLVGLVRQAGVKAARDDFYRQAGGVRDAIERSAAAVATPTPGAERIGNAAAPVQACWLNRTVRAATDPLVLADVVDDPSVARLDVPRPLVPEAVEIDVMLEALAGLRGKGFPTGAGVTVGVIDSEVALGHPALEGRVIHRRNYTQEPFATPGTHGTAVAGIVAARSDEYTGVAPDALIYSYKVIANSRLLGGTDFEGALAIQHALEDGIRVVNCSWGAGPASDGRSREARACNTAWGLGLTIVKSAGNNGPGARTLTTPSDADGVIAVGATDPRGQAIAEYSSRGPTSDGRHRPHLLAPGGSRQDHLHGLAVGGGFTDITAGTSFAAPHVAGLVALLLESEPDILPDAQRDRLIAACTPIAAEDEDAQGAGFLSVEALFAAS
jgi:serine protease AprX